MTTEAVGKFEICVALNLFESNDCLKFPPLHDGGVWPIIACVSVSQSAGRQASHDLMRACVERAWDSFLRDTAEWTFWLFACVCGEDNRVVRHKGVWKLLEQQGVPLAGHAESETLVVRDDGTLCLYGAMCAEVDRIATFWPVVSASSRSFLALLPRGQSPGLDLVIAAGWQRGLSNLEELRDIALAIVKQGGVLFRLFGEFDDREVGVDCIMAEDACQTAVALMHNADAI